MVNGVAMSGLGYDPYFMTAYQYNPYYAQYVTQLQAQQGQQTQQTTVSAAQTTKAAEKKDHSKAGLILGGVALVGAAVLCHKAYKVGSGEGFAKLGDGFKTLWNSAKNKVNNVVNPEKFTILENGNKTVCTVPKRTNIMRTENVTQALSDIGENAANEILSADALKNGTQKLRNFTYTDDKGNIIKVVKGNIVEYKKGAITMTGRYNVAEKLSKTEYSRLTQLVQDCMNGNNLDKMTDITFSQSGNGVAKLFRTAKASDAATISSAATKKFAVNSEAVKAYCSDHPKYKEAIEQFLNGNRENWNMYTGEYEINNVGTLLFKDNKIAGIKVNGTTYDTSSEKFKALKGDNEKVFTEAINHKDQFTNKTWRL